MKGGGLKMTLLTGTGKQAGNSVPRKNTLIKD